MGTKLDKNTLKFIVKECLIEILAEGIVGNNVKSYNKKQAFNEALTRKQKTSSLTNLGSYSQKSKPKRTHHLDNIRYDNKQNDRVNEAKSNRNANIPKGLAKDDIMHDILADTAQTTLREQISADHRKGQHISRPSDKAAQIVSESDPSELFAESAGKWATLAFGS